MDFNHGCHFSLFVSSFWLVFFASRRWTAKNAEVIVKRATYSAWISKDGEELVTFSKLVRENNVGLENEIQIDIWTCYSDMFNADFQICSSRATTEATHVIWVDKWQVEELEHHKVSTFLASSTKAKGRDTYGKRSNLSTLTLPKTTAFHPLKIRVSKKERSVTFQSASFCRGLWLLVSTEKKGGPWPTTPQLRLAPSRIHKISPTSPFRWGLGRGWWFRWGWVDNPELLAVADLMAVTGWM